MRSLHRSPVDIGPDAPDAPPTRGARAVYPDPHVGIGMIGPMTTLARAAARPGP
jgi:hypothetical protein